MRKVTLIIILVFAYSTSCHAQRKRRYKEKSKAHHFALKNNVLSYFIKTFNLSLEYQIKDRHSVQGVVQWYKARRVFENWFMGNGDLIHTDGYSIGIEYRFYPYDDNDHLNGFYVSPYGRFFHRDMEFFPYESSGPFGDTRFKRDMITYGVIIGVQSIKKNHIGYDFFIGVGGRNKTDYDYTNEITPHYKINDFMDGNGEIRLGLNVSITSKS